MCAFQATLWARLLCAHITAQYRAISAAVQAISTGKTHIAPYKDISTISGERQGHFAKRVSYLACRMAQLELRRSDISVPACAGVAVSVSLVELIYINL